MFLKCEESKLSAFEDIACRKVELLKFVSSKIGLSIHFFYKVCKEKNGYLENEWHLSKLQVDEQEWNFTGTTSLNQEGKGPLKMCKVWPWGAVSCFQVHS